MDHMASSALYYGKCRPRDRIQLARNTQGVSGIAGIRIKAGSTHLAVPSLASNLYPELTLEWGSMHLCLGLLEGAPRAVPQGSPQPLTPHLLPA